MGRRFFGIQVRASNFSWGSIFFTYTACVFFFFSRPERWETTPDAAASIPGIWGHMLTFLGGPRACIGYRFALVEYVHSLSLFSSGILISNTFFIYFQDEGFVVHSHQGI